MKNQKLIQTNTNIDIYTTYEFLFFPRTLSDVPFAKKLEITWQFPELDPN